MRPSGPVPTMRVASMTQSFASAAARGLMRNNVGRLEIADGSWGIAATGVVAGAATVDVAIGFGVETVGAAAAATGAVFLTVGAGSAGGIGSPGFPRKPTVLCTGTLTLGGTTILISVPASKLSTSMTDLSVSTVKRMSPLSTLSPSFLSHSTMALSSVI